MYLSVSNNLRNLCHGDEAYFYHFAHKTKKFLSSENYVMYYCDGYAMLYLENSNWKC